MERMGCDSVFAFNRLLWLKQRENFSQLLLCFFFFVMQSSKRQNCSHAKDSEFEARRNNINNDGFERKQPNKRNWCWRWKFDGQTMNDSISSVCSVDVMCACVLAKRTEDGHDVVSRNINGKKSNQSKNISMNFYSFIFLDFRLSNFYSAKVERSGRRKTNKETRLNKINNRFYISLLVSISRLVFFSLFFFYLFHDGICARNWYY